jgi:hypothetical protein
MFSLCILYAFLKLLTVFDLYYRYRYLFGYRYSGADEPGGADKRDAA